MAMISLTSASNTNLSKTISIENKNNLRNDSFSSYLNGAEETFVLKLAETSQSLHSFVSNRHEHLYIGNKKVEDGEIDVFGAEKYFNERVLAQESRKIANKSSLSSHQEKDEQVDVVPIKPQTQQGTPSVRSESSSNSQSVLLNNIPINQTRTKGKKVPGKSFLANLACNCGCSDKNSVDVYEHHVENSSSGSVKNAQEKAITKQPLKTNNVLQISKPQPDSWGNEEMHCKKFDEPGYELNTEDRFSFPVLNTTEGNLILKIQSGQADDAARKSLDVFGSPVLQRGKKSLSLERRLTMLNWDTISPREEEMEISAHCNGNYNDSASDASSDLFEIESFSTNGPFLTRQSSVGTSNCVTPRTCYAPSEASIEWSVVTASAADFSMMSDSEELRISSSATNPNRNLLNGKKTPGKEMQKRRQGILPSCKSHKAVRVAGEACRTNDQKVISDPRRPHKSDSFTSMPRFQAENKLTGLGSRHGGHGSDALPLSQTHPRRPSQLLSIQ